MDRFVANAQAMEILGGILSRGCPDGLTIFLHGQLGAGKTTLVRGFLHALGHTGAVKSPTYTLVEPYELEGRRVYHFDLYRLADPEELEYLGVRDYFDGQALSLVEWPERGSGVLPAPDLDIRIEVEGAGRRVYLAASTDRGERVIEALDIGADALHGS